MPRVCTSIVQRFWRYVDVSGPHACWIWTGAKANFGYGVLGKGARGTGTIRARRFSYAIHKGEIPEGLLVRHKCDTPSCVNPEHLELGTQEDNMQDALKRKRINIAPSHVKLAEIGAWGKPYCRKGHPKTPYNWHNERLDGAGKNRCFACRRERRAQTQKPKEVKP